MDNKRETDKTPELKNEGKEDFKVEEFSLGDEEK